MGSIDTPKFLREKMKQTITSGNVKASMNTPDFLKKKEGAAVSETTTEDLSTGTEDISTQPLGLATEITKTSPFDFKRQLPQEFSLPANLKREEEKIREADKKIFFGDISAKELSDLQQNPYTKKIADQVIRQYVPEAIDNADNQKFVELAAKNIKEKNRINFVNAEKAGVSELDNNLLNLVSELRQGVPANKAGRMTDYINELRQEVVIDDFTNNDRISDAISKIKKIENLEQRYYLNPEEKNKSRQKNEAILKTLNDRLQYNISRTGITPTINQLNDQIEQAVLSKVMESERGEPIKDAAKDQVKISHFKLGLTAAEKTDPILFNNVVNAIASEKKIADQDFKAIADTGQQIDNKMRFRGGAYDPTLIDTENNFDYITFGQKKAQAAMLIGEWAKDKGYRNVAELPERIIRQGAKEKGVDNQEIVNSLVFDEKLFLYDAIPKAGWLDDVASGIMQPLQGINSTLNSWTESPAQTYLRSKSFEPEIGGQKVPDKKGQYSDILPSERGRFLTDMFRGLGQFIPQVLLTKGVGAGLKGTAALSGVPLTGRQAKNVADFGGTFVSTFLQSYGPSYEEHLQKTGDASTAALIGTIDGISAGGFELFLPDVRLAGKAFDGLKKGLSTDLVGLIKSGGDPAELASKARPFIQKFFKNATNILAQETSEELGTQYVDFVTESIFDPESTKERNLNKELWDVFKSTTAAMLIPSILGAGGSSFQKDFTVNSLHSAAINFDSYKESLQNSLDKEYISQNDFNKAVQLLSTHKQSIDATPEINANGSTLNPRQKLDYAFEDTKIKVYKDKAEKSDGVAKEMWEGKIKQAEDIQREILIPKETVAEITEVVTPGETVIEETTTDLTPEETIIDAAGKGNLEGTYGEMVQKDPSTATAVILDLAKQKYGILEDGTEDPNGGRDISMKTSLDVDDAVTKAFPDKESVINAITQPKTQTNEEAQTDQTKTEASVLTQQGTAETPATEVVPIEEPSGGNTYDEIQNKIDRIEDRLEKEGKNPTKMFDSSEHTKDDFPDGYEPMPKELADLYKQRFEIEKNDREAITKSIINTSGLSESEAESILGDLGMSKNSPTYRFADAVDKWYENFNKKIESIYNRVFIKNNPSTEEHTSFSFNIKGKKNDVYLSADKQLDEKTLKQAESIYNSIAITLGKDKINLSGLIEKGEQKLISEETPPTTQKANEETKPTEVVAEPKTIATKGKELADKIRQLKTKRDVLQANIFGIPIAIYDGAIEVVATAIENGAILADAIRDGMNSIEEKYRKKLDVERFSKHIEDVAEGKKPKLRTTGEIVKPPKPPKEDTTTGEEEPVTERRQFSEQVLEDKKILPQVKKGVTNAIEYTRQTNRMSLEEAEEILNRVGEDEAFALVSINDELKPAVRVVLGQVLIKRYNELAKEAKGTNLEDFYIDKTIDVANYVSEKLGTEAGQMIQAFSLWSRLTPEAQLRSASKEKREQGKKNVERVKKDINSIGTKLQQANAEAADELLNSKKKKESVKNTETLRIKKARDKVASAQNRRNKLIEDRKKGKGGALFSSVGGLTPEGIEFVGNVAATYIQEGIARAEIIIQKISEHLKEISGKDLPEDVSRNVSDIVTELVQKDQNKKIVSGLSEMEKEVNRIVKEHYTVPEASQTSLTDKFIQQTGLDAELSAKLGKDIQDEFEAIVKRKKDAILYNEKARFDKIQKGLGTKKESKTIQDDILKYSNLGAFDNADFTDFLTKKLEVGRLTQEEAKAIVALSEKIQKAPEGSPKNDATQELLAYRANMKGISWMETLQAIWYANILSGYGTHLVNIVSTFFNGMGFFSAEAFRDPRSIPVLVYGGARGLNRGLREAWHTISTGKTPIHVSKVETPGTLERQRFIGGYFNPYNYLKFVGRLMAAEDVLQFQGLKEMRATQLAYREAKKMGSKNPFSKETWKIINEKLLNTKERSDAAFAQAKEEGLKEKSVERKRRVYELMENSRPIEMSEDAYGFAARGTFNFEPEGTLGAITNAVSQALNLEVSGARPLRFLVPFTRIITNVVNNALDFGPVGLIRAARGGSVFTGSKFRQLTPEQRNQLIARASLGIAMTGGLYALTKVPCKDGHNVLDITGAGTGDYLKDAQLKETGWQPYSIRVCGGSYISYKYTPLVFNLGFLGYINDREKYANKDEDDFTNIMGALYQTGQLALDGTWVGSTSDIMKTLAESNPSQLVKNLEKTISNMALQATLPNAYVQGATTVEEWLRLPKKDAKTFYERLIQHIPVARNSLNNKINALGEEIPTDIDRFISERKPHKVFDYLTSKKSWVTPINKNSFIVYDIEKNIERPATNDEYYKFSKLRGQKIKEDVESLLDSGVTITENRKKIEKTAQELTTAELSKVMRKIKTDATKEAKAEMFGDAKKKPKFKIEINEEE